MKLKYNKYSHCDIDLDVLDPNQFPYVGNRISNGININTFKNILNDLNFKDIKVICDGTVSPDALLICFSLGFSKVFH